MQTIPFLDPKWSHEAVLLLISLKTEFSGMFSSNIITQKQAWKRISEEICNKGYHFSGDVCDRKFRSLKMRFTVEYIAMHLEKSFKAGEHMIIALSRPYPVLMLSNHLGSCFIKWLRFLFQIAHIQRPKAYHGFMSKVKAKIIIYGSNISLIFSPWAI